MYCIAELYRQGDMSGAAEEMYLWELRGKEKAWGAEHTSTTRHGQQSRPALRRAGQDGGSGGDVPSGTARI